MIKHLLLLRPQDLTVSVIQENSVDITFYPAVPVVCNHWVMCFKCKVIKWEEVQKPMLYSGGDPTFLA